MYVIVKNGLRYLHECQRTEDAPLVWKTTKKGAMRFSNFNTAQAVALAVGGYVVSAKVLK